MAQIRFLKGGAYNSDLRSLRDAIRANAVNVNCVPITLTHPLAPGQKPVFYLNMAYQANSNMPLVTASLYIVAFRNGAGAGFRFNLPVVPAGAPPFTLLASDGRYRNLGSDGSFPPITNGNLAESIGAVATYAGGALTDAMKKGLVRLLIATSEAVRLSSVESGVAGVLGNGGTYNPPWDPIHAWGGHSLP